MAEGLVGGEGFAVDTSLIEADANKQRSVPGHEWRIEDIPARPRRPSETISALSMMRPSALPAMWCRSSSDRQIRQPSGQLLCVVQPSSPMPTII
jgi:hypothetical protein